MKYKVLIMYNDVIYQYVLNGKSELYIIMNLPKLLGNKTMYNIIEINKL